MSVAIWCGNGRAEPLMTKREKRLQKIRQNPNNVSMDDLEQVLNDYGIYLDHATGSHHIFRYNLKGKRNALSIPYAKPIKSKYVKDVINIIDQVKEEENDE